MQWSISKIILNVGALMALFLFGAIGQAQVVRATGLLLLTGAGPVPLEDVVGSSQLKKSNLLEMQIKYHVVQYLAIPGRQSSIRSNQSAAGQVFLVRLSMPVPADSPLMTTLATMVPPLYLLVRNKGERNLVTSDITGTLFWGKNHDPSPRVAVNVTRQDDYTLRVSPQLPLLPGEYAFNTGEVVTDTAPQRYAVISAPQAFKLYCFGID